MAKGRPLTPSQRQAKQERDRAYRSRAKERYGVSVSTRSALRNRAAALDLDRKAIDEALQGGADSGELRQALGYTEAMQKAWLQGDMKKASEIYGTIPEDLLDAGLPQSLFFYHVIRF